METFHFEYFATLSGTHIFRNPSCKDDWVQEQPSQKWARNSELCVLITNKKNNSEFL